MFEKAFVTIDEHRTMLGNEDTNKMLVSHYEALAHLKADKGALKAFHSNYGLLDSARAQTKLSEC